MDASPPKTMRALVVDDVPEILRTITPILQRAIPGVLVATQTDSRLAAKLLDSHSFDLIVADLRMPEITGLELLTHARSRQPTSKRVLMSGHYEPIIDEVFLRGYGLHGFIKKPFNAPEIVVFLRSLAAGTTDTPIVIPAEGEPAPPGSLRRA